MTAGSITPPNLPSFPQQEGGIGPFFQRAVTHMRQHLSPPFSTLDDHTLTLMFAEKQMLTLESNERTLHYEDEEGQITSGYNNSFQAEIDHTHPLTLKTFQAQGIYLPQNALDTYHIDTNASCPLTRVREGEQETLFIIHPKSQAHYQRLLDEYPDQEKISLPCLATSSFRTLFVALPNDEIILCKVSLDQTIGYTSRLVSEKECKASIVASYIAGKKGQNLTMIQETHSFVPKSCPNAGMIYRQNIPKPLDPTSFTLPFYTLYGVENRNFLLSWIFASIYSPTEFFQKVLIKPLTETLVKNLFFEHISFQIHGQNLLMEIDNSTPELPQVRYLYRDAGGININIADKKSLVPEQYTDSSFFWEETHLKDAAQVIDLIATWVFFNCTKLFVKTRAIHQADKEFCAWYQDMKTQGFLGNWTTGNDEDNCHEKEFTNNTFYRYGYLEKLFATQLLDTMKQYDCIDATLQQRLLQQLQRQNGQCLDFSFKSLILETYIVD